MRKSVIIVVAAILALGAMPALAASDDIYIAAANHAVEIIVQVAIDRIEAAHTYAEMVFWANWADTQVYRVLAWLERKIGPVEYEVEYVTVYNEEVGRSVTFDPIHVIGG